MMKINIKYQHFLHIVSLLCSLLFLLSVSVYTVNYTADILYERMESINRTVFLQQYQTLYSSLVDVIVECSYTTAEDSLFWKYDKEIVKNPSDFADYYAKIKKDVEEVVALNEYIKEIQIVTDFYLVVGAKNDCTTIQRNYSMEYLDNAYHKYMKDCEEGEILFFYPDSTEELNYTSEEYGFLMPLIHESVPKGWLILILRDSVIKNVDISKGLILDRDNHIMYGSAVNLEECMEIIGNSETIRSGEDIEVYRYNKKVVLKKNIGSIGISYISLYDFASYQPLRVTYITITAIFLVSLLLAIMLSRLIANKLVEPVNLLRDAINRLQLHHGKYMKLKTGKRKKNRLSFRESAFIYMVLVIFVPSTLFLLITFGASRYTIERQINDANELGIQQLLNNVNGYMRNKQTMLQNIIFDADIQSVFEQGLGENVLYATIDRKLKIGNSQNTIVLYDVYRKRIFTNENENSEYVISEQEFESSGSKRKIYTWKACEINEYGEYAFRILVKTNSITRFNNIGFLACYASENEIEKLYRNFLGSDIDIYILDENDNIVSAFNKELIGREYGFGEEGSIRIGTENAMHTYAFNLKYGNWKLVAQVNDTFGRSEITSFMLQRMYFIIIVLFSSLTVSFAVTAYMSNWIKSMNRSLKTIRISDMPVEIKKRYIIDEFNMLNDSFNHMVKTNRKLLLQLVESAKAKAELSERGKKSELSALQFQINSHFIYNAFDGINWLIKSGKNSDAITMVSYISHFLRYAARTKSPIVSVGEEIEHAKTYIHLLKMRFRDNIDFLWDIDTDTFPYQTLRLSLQPIIENAIFHGIYPLQNAGIVEIECGISAGRDRLFFIVTDDGCGIGQDALEELRTGINEHDTEKSIGLNNIQTRIHLYFGMEYGISIESQVSVGTKVMITLPLQMLPASSPHARGFEKSFDNAADPAYNEENHPYPAG